MNINKQALLNRLWILDGPGSIADIVREIQSGRFDSPSDDTGYTRWLVGGLLNQTKEIERLRTALEKITDILGDNTSVTAQLIHHVIIHALSTTEPTGAEQEDHPHGTDG